MAEHGPQSTAPDSALDIEQFKAGEAQVLELLKATIAFEHAALRPPVLLNGGALIAALTFLGHAGANITSNGVKVDFALVRLAFIAWSIGLFGGAVATSLGYFSQQAFLKSARRKRDAERSEDDAKKAGQLCRHREWDAKGRCRRSLAYAFAGGSLVAFVIGMFLGLFGLS